MLPGLESSGWMTWMAGTAVLRGWPSIVNAPFRGVRTTQRILLAGLSGCPARSGLPKRNPAASGGFATTYGTPIGLLCAPASSSQVGIDPRTAAVDPQPPATATGLPVGAGDGDLSAGWLAPSPEHETRPSETTVISTSLMTVTTRHRGLRFQPPLRATVPCTGSSRRDGCVARRHSAGRGAGVAVRWRPAPASA